MIRVEDVLKRTEEILQKKKKHIQSDQIQALAEALVEEINDELRGVKIKLGLPL